MPVFETEPDDLGRRQRIDPSSAEAESALLGIMLRDNLAVYAEIRDIIKPEHFYLSTHVMLAERMFALSRRGQLADAIVMKNRLAQTEDLVDIGGVEYLALLVDNAPPARTAPEYARLVADMFSRRALIRLTEDVLKTANDPDSEESAEDMVSRYGAELGVVQETFPSSARFITMQEAARQAAEAIGEDRAMGINTGYDELDNKLAGLGRGKLIVIAGRPSMGKTSLVTNIARNVAKEIAFEDGSPVPGKVGFFSQEMPALELGERSLSAELGPKEEIEYRDITAHDLTSSKTARVRSAVEDVSDHVLIDETAGLTYSELEKRARAMEKQLGGLDVLVVDYLQLMEGTDAPDPRSDVKYYGWISNNLKKLAKKMNIAVLLLSQLSRKVEDRENKRPRKADLKGSGTIEDAADVILFVFRPEYYLVEAGEPEGREKKEAYFKALNFAKNKMDIIIGKNKGGPLGVVPLRCFLPYDIITELADDGEGLDEEIAF